MPTSLRARTDHRALADQRLSDLTFATAVVGLAATIGFGGLAAVTYAGVPNPVAADPAQDTLTVPQTHTGSNPSTTNGGSTTTRPNTNSTNGSSLGGGSSSGISRSSGRAHVSTGSS
jgi:hypothetical protein